jgi:hypothetical protein
MSRIPVPIPMWFGTSEELKCLQGIERVEIQTAAGKQDVCYAAKIKKENFILPFTISVDGYVLAVNDKTYYKMNNEQAAYYQTAGRLPTPLPIYSLTPGDILGGTLLWPVIGAVLAVATWQNLMRAPSAQSSTFDYIQCTDQQQAEQARDPKEKHE